ncbi:A/G-specific adenine glycosylase [Thermaerobacillus caldiproteolyticus]|uniref:Adenine DNA glycosylase n=1 Tax=Thermaerobacillus caldiproteolyticus TaxID=247480 RepID=A0A7W0C098_9BACL|nr:A/G-specific adenine glycosylase [Anoxybacillus caldiproteolyticus]MBA2876520.1 A/G-specific adenine glycosylase [Anoxybacillus caldiproteolyticus]QPA31383.1 A/G-specific adenine glycosylase [Anoxybacillus caldiproteolyticus]
MNEKVKRFVEGFLIDTFQRDLISWFEKEQRDLPWRKDTDPYKIWVSEVMLQQTRVETVIPYFHHFMEQFPTLEALADADEEKVLKAWEGLGYYSRIRNLHAAVKEVKERYGGKVPNRVEEFSKLKGVGPYTTGAVLSIAYGIPEPAVDGNVMRVLSRIFLVWDDITKAGTRKLFEGIVREIIDEENPSYFNQALMELGALICIPRNPACLLCPVQAHCRAFHEGVQGELPVKTKKTNVREMPIVAAVVQNECGKVLIHKRDSEGLLANLWEFPNCEVVHSRENPKTQLEIFLKEEYGVTVQLEQPFAALEHVFSHLIWNIVVYYGKIVSDIVETERLKLVDEHEISEYAFPVSHQRIWHEYKEKGTGG